MKKLAWSAIFLSLMSPVSAEQTGNKLYELCTVNPQALSGYVSGVIDKASLDVINVVANQVHDGTLTTQAAAEDYSRSLKAASHDIESYCLAEGVTLQQASDVVL
jgi:hypothetical protein